MAVDAFRGTFPYARTDWDRPNTTQTASWTSTLTNNLVNEASYTYALDEVFINVFAERPLQAQQVRHQLSVHLPGEQGDPRQDPDDHDRQLHRDRRRSVSRRRRAARSTPSANTTTWVKGRHTLKGGIVVRVLGRGRLRPDQRPADPRQHQQPERPRSSSPTAPTARHRARHRGRGARAVHELRRDRPARADEVARARDRHLRPGLVAADAAT